jgi:hypothetical protein
MTKHHRDQEDACDGKRPKQNPGRIEPVPYALSSSPLLELSSFDDDPSKAGVIHKIRKYRWLFTYSSESALNELDFQVDVTRVMSIARGEGKWMSLATFKEKMRLLQVINLIRGLDIKGPVAIEVVHGGTHRFNTAAVNEDSLTGSVVKHYVSNSPSRMLEGGEAFFKMRMLF